MTFIENSEETSTLSTPPDYKLYNERAIYLGTFMGGPLVAGYLMSENFKQLGNMDGVRNSWLISIAATVLIFSGVFLIPHMDKFPRYIIPISYSLIAQYVAKHFQGKDILEHTVKGGTLYAVWRSVWIGLVGLVVLLVIIFSVVVIINAIRS